MADFISGNIARSYVRIFFVKPSQFSQYISHKRNLKVTFEKFIEKIGLGRFLAKV